MTRSRNAWWIPLTAVACLTTLTAGSAAPEVPKVSGFAPSNDLLQQVDFFIGRIEESLAEPADFDLAKQSRTVKDGHTLAAIGLVLSVHDEDHPLKKSAASLVRSSQALALADDDFAKAKTALDGIKAARAGKASGDATVPWEKVASLAALMKTVPLVHTGLKRGVEGNRLARTAAQSAGQAATLAAIAQASLLDPEVAKTPAEVEKWQAYCAQMRDAAGEVNAAVHAQDAARVSAGMKRLTQSCDACHAQFRSH